MATVEIRVRRAWQCDECKTLVEPTLMTFKSEILQCFDHVCPDGFVPPSISTEVGHTRVVLIPPMGGLERSLLFRNSDRWRG